MAGDWIPLRKGLERTPEFLFIQRESGCSPGAVLLALFRLWSWFDDESVDGFIPWATLENLSDFCGQDLQFWKIIEKSKWIIRVEYTNEKGPNSGRVGLELPNFDRWMGESAKKRLLDSKRKRKGRGKGIVSWKNRTNVRENSDEKAPTGQDSTVQDSTDTKDNINTVGERVRNRDHAPAFLAEVAADPRYQDKDVEAVFGKLVDYCKRNGGEITKTRLEAWVRKEKGNGSGRRDEELQGDRNQDRRGNGVRKPTPLVSSET